MGYNNESDSSIDVMSFRVPKESKIPEKIAIVNRFLVGVGQHRPEDDGNSSETNRWCIEFVYKIIDRVIEQRVAGDNSKQLVIDLNF